jgi:hypothetical protein
MTGAGPQPGESILPPETGLLCPSAPPVQDNGVAFGVVGGTAEEPRVGYLRKRVAVTDSLLAATAPVKPTEVLRFAAPCAATACQHFDGAECTLARNVVQLLPVAVGQLPQCIIRPDCRWWSQEGKAACLRCPGIITESPEASEAYRRAADPAELRSAADEGSDDFGRNRPERTRHVDRRSEISAR